MPPRRSREEWLRDLDARQRNIVFPDTVNNEARFWRNVVNGKQRLNAVQRAGVAMFVLVAIVIALLITFGWTVPLTYGFTWRGLAAGMVDWLIGLGVLGLFLLMFHLSQRWGRK